MIPHTAAGYDEKEYTAVVVAVVAAQSVWILQTTSSSLSSLWLYLFVPPVHVHSYAALDLESRRVSSGREFQLILFLLVVVVLPNRLDEGGMTMMITRRRSDDIPQLSGNDKETIVSGEGDDCDDDEWGLNLKLE